MFVTLSSHTFEHISFRIVKKHRICISYSPHCFTTIISENDQKTTTRLTIHQNYQKPNKIKKHQYLLIPTANSPPKKRKAIFSDPPNYLPECFPQLQGPLTTPQTHRGPPKTSPGPARDTRNALPGSLQDTSSIPAEPSGCGPSRAQGI